MRLELSRLSALTSDLFPLRGGRSKLVTPDIEGKVRVTSAITCLLLGPIDLGNKMLAKEGILEMMLVMANTDDLLQQVPVGLGAGEARKFVLSGQ